MYNFNRVLNYVLNFVNLKKGNLLMNKAIIIALLVCTGLFVAGCEKTYSVTEFKKDPKLLNQWLEKCFIAGSFDSKNCKNAEQAELETRKKWGIFGSGKDDQEKTEDKKEGN